MPRDNGFMSRPHNPPQRPGFDQTTRQRMYDPQYQTKRAVENYGVPEDRTTGKSLPPHAAPDFPFTPTEKNQIRNIERGSGATNAGEDTLRKQNI